MDVIKLTKELSKAITESEEMTALKDSHKEIEEHEAAKIMLRDLKAFQKLIDKKRLSGEDISEEDMDRFKRVFENAQMNPYSRNVLMAEAKLSEMINEVWKAISEAINSAIGEEDIKN